MSEVSGSPNANLLGDLLARKSRLENELFFPGTFGRQKALREADKNLEEAEKQLILGNLKAAKALAVKVLQTAQDGSWNIWGNLSAGVERAKQILIQEEVSIANVIRYYAPLIEAERYVPKWVPAQHLIGKIGPLLNETEGQQLLDAVIDHFRLVVGDAPHEIQAFDFLADDSPGPSSEVEYFRFIVWLCNHPQWLRRDRAAAMLLWLVEQDPALFSDAVTTAFSMGEGYGPDVLCGGAFLNQCPQRRSDYATRGERSLLSDLFFAFEPVICF